MAISVKHAFNSLKGDGTDATLVQPSQWNAAHSTSMATGNLLGRATAGVGVFEELPISALVTAALPSVDGPTFLSNMGVGGFTAGDIKLTLKTVADAGWVLFDNGTMGSATSGGTTRANADTLAAYTVIWNSVIDAWAPVVGGRGASAAADFAANKPITLPKTLGRALAIAGSGAGLTARVLGSTLGGEAATLITANLPPYTPTGTITNGAITSTVGGTGNGTLFYNASGGFTSTNGSTARVDGNLTVTSTQATSTFAGAAQGGISTPVSIMPPVSFLNAMLKL